MPSRAEIRSRLEGALRVASIGLLAWLGWLVFDTGDAPQPASARSANLPASLERWSAGGVYPREITIRLDSMPSALTRDWLRALGRAGSTISWNGDIDPVAVGIIPIVSPRGGQRVSVAAPSQRVVTLRDDVGPIDTATALRGGVSFSIAAAAGAIAVQAGGTVARTASADTVRVKRVMVIGNAGWETKFVVAALEEDGWTVDATMRVAPGVAISQGSSLAIDTARHAAVIAVDESAAPRAAEVTRFVANGGGLILAGRAAASSAFESVRAGVPARAVVSPSAGNPSQPKTRASIDYLPIAALRRDAVVLERRGTGVVSAGRRHVAGRVLQVGHVDTWEWRMRGGDDSDREHREWWSGLVASVAYSGYRSLPADGGENAPYPRLVEALGRPTVSRSSLAAASGRVSLWAPFLLLVVSLLAEWVSRRTRGLR